MGTSKNFDMKFVLSNDKKKSMSGGNYFFFKMTKAVFFQIDERDSYLAKMTKGSLCQKAIFFQNDKRQYIFITFIQGKHLFTAMF